MTEVFPEHRQGFVDLANDEGADPTRRSLARASYVALLPERPLSRCPFTGELVTVPFDCEGLDGPFWDSQDPARRPPDGGFVDTLVSWTGGVRLRRDVPQPAAPFMALPGPEVPFVVEALLTVDDVVAVIAPNAVGQQEAFSVSYFAPDHRVVDQTVLLNDWGSRSYWLTYRSGASRSGESTVYDLDFEYEIDRWIQNEKLRWIAPGDESWTIRTGTSGCPFLDWDGERDMQRVIDGRIMEF